MPIEARDTEARVKVMEEALHFSPIRQGAFRYAALLQLNGQPEAASAQLKRAMLAYPGDIAMVEKQFAAVANDSPELGQLKPLIEQLRQRSF
jgi:predicted TPR repeat methyltransferase